MTAEIELRVSGNPFQVYWIASMGIVCWCWIWYFSIRFWAFKQVHTNENTMTIPFPLITNAIIVRFRCYTHSAPSGVRQMYHLLVDGFFPFDFK